MGGVTGVCSVLYGLISCLGLATVMPIDPRKLV